MRLTNAVKAQIIKSWVDEKWLKKLNASFDNLKVGIKIEAEDQMKIGIEIYKSNKEIQQYLKCKNYLETYYLQEKISNCGYINKIQSTVSCSNYVTNSHYSANEFNAKTKGSIKATNKHNELIAKFDGELKSIQDILNSVTTVKKLSDLLPDIEKYLPKTVKGTMLVSVDCLSRAKAAL